MMTTGTRLLMMTLLTTGVGTSEVEDNAFRMVREKVQRGPNGSKKAEFNQYSRLNKRDKIRFLVRNREEKIVKDLISVKVNVIKELEKELFKEVKATWKRLEEVHRQGSRTWRSIRKRMMKDSEKIWDDIRRKNDSKVGWLLTKYGNMNRSKSQEVVKMSDIDEEMIKDIDYTDEDLETTYKDFKEKETLIYGKVEVSKNIEAVMKLDPKFATLPKLEMKDIKAEVELMLTKVRYNRMNNDDEEESDSEDDTNDDEMNESQEEEFILAHETSREIFDPRKQKLDLRKRRCTDLPTNPRVFLPGARPPGEEAELSTRSSRILAAVSSYIDNKCDDRGNQKDKILSREESEGVKELLKKIKDEEVVVTKTDKSHRLALIEIGMFENMGKEHTKKDRKVDWDTIRLKQVRLTGLCRGLSKCFGVGESWGVRNIERVRDSYHTLSGIAPVFTVMPKDHKKMNGDVPPSRPLCKASTAACMNGRLSDILTDILNLLPERRVSVRAVVRRRCSTT